MPASCALGTGTRVRTRSQTRAQIQSASEPQVAPEPARVENLEPVKVVTRKKNQIVPWRPAPANSTRSKASGSTTTTAGTASTEQKKSKKNTINPPKADTAQAVPTVVIRESSNASNESSPNGTSGLTGRSLLRASQEKFEDMKCSTPIKIIKRGDGSLKDEKEILMAQLEDIPEYDQDYLRSLYAKSIPSDMIETFLETSPLYDSKKKRWVGVPRVARLEDDLYKPFVKIIQAIIDGPGKPKKGVKSTRTAIDTHDKSFIHHDSDKLTRPDLAILATGPSFQEPLPKEGQTRVPGYMVGYSNVASVFDFKLNRGDPKYKQVEQLALYNSQPNRRYCRSLIITEDKVALLHYDRSGAYITEMVNLHEEPHVFVRLVLALSAHKEKHLGLDTSIQWTVGANGRKIAGTICVRDGRVRPINEEKYELDMSEPPQIYNTIRGPGTTRWIAKDKTGARIYVGDAWRASGRTPEHKLLEQIHGKKVEGVLSEIMAFEDKIAQTKEYRPKNFQSNNFFNRTFSRVALKQAGPPLTAFTSQLEAITVLRGGIIAHRNLLIAGVLHRDITIKNILITKDEKNQSVGKLCDLATAIPSYEKAKISLEPRVVPRLYLSTSVLRTSEEEKHMAPGVHDYLDDLEAFNYVLAVLLLRYKGINTVNPPEHDGNQVLEGWIDSTGFAASLTKLDFLRTGAKSGQVAAFWSETCIQLCYNVSRYLYPLAKRKKAIREKYKDKWVSARKARFRRLYDKIDEHYSVIIGFFDAALVELGKPGGQDPRYTTPPPSPPTNIGQRCYEVAENAAVADADAEDSESESPSSAESSPWRDPPSQLAVTSSGTDVLQKDSADSMSSPSIRTRHGQQSQLGIQSLRYIGPAKVGKRGLEDVDEKDDEDMPPFKRKKTGGALFI
ncbi:hypothetical protein DFP72DRAFT_1062604 [Ephemerocybe angulata]|uniref:Fungal-type protein kinase domain-containing protein n=1 Tax=Ephemerocybe angulata TaxID=980116 RepID=A0A8H6M9H3_9AGAR|nr:hypothetical protein DFP72DRAFT_1062604 [Tulosesus angulatus]